MSAPHPDLLTLLAGFAAILVAASVIGYALQSRLSPDGSNTAIENLNDRIRAWWVMVALMALALIGGRTGVTLLFASCSFAALREFVTLTSTRRADHWALAGAFFAVLPIQYYLIWISWYGLYSIFIPVYAFLLMPIIAVLRVRMVWLWPALRCCFSCAPSLREVMILAGQGYESSSVLLTALLVVVGQSSDVGDDVGGRLGARTRLPPVGTQPV